MSKAAPDIDVDIDVDGAFQELTQHFDHESCEFINVCDVHGEEPCTMRARWVATLVARDDDGSDVELRVMGCDKCHDDIVADGNCTIGGARVVQWIEL